MGTGSRKRLVNRVVMVATENDALRGAKVGGIGDVIRDLPGALAPLGWETTVIIPSYGFLHRTNPSELTGTVDFPFGGNTGTCEVWRAAPPDAGAPAAEHLILHHPAIAGDPIYFNDSSERVFARDASKFALFCSAAGMYLKNFAGPYVLHLHDWHTGYLFLLSHLHPAFSHLKKVRKVFTIHNIGYQGTRPMREFPPSVEDWFPELFVKASWVPKWKDPRYAVPTFTPMLAGIERARAVTTVSPTYAKEIMTESDHANAVYGGEGLEPALRRADAGGRLHGILNGIAYRDGRQDPAVSDLALLDTILREIGGDKNGDETLLRAEIVRRLRRVLGREGSFLLTCVTRISEQKVRLLFERGSSGESALESILRAAGRHRAAWIFVGTGIEEYESLLRSAFLKHESFIFLNGFYRQTAAGLFRRGNLFVMPSSYEPCGITQMQAMREGQPCLVHAVGGLRDTVADGVDGFTFSGSTLTEKVDNFVSAARGAIGMYHADPGRWSGIVAGARRARFRWEESARAYDRVFRG